MRALLKPDGRAGIIVPTGIATDDTNKFFFEELLKKGELISLYDFENREALFPSVHKSYKFSLLTFEKRVNPYPNKPFKLVFFATRIEHLKEGQKNLTLTYKDIEKINPNTLTLPVFRTKQDAELTKYIYSKIPVLINEKEKSNPWKIKFLRMFDMSNDSHLFKTSEELLSKGFEKMGNRFVKDKEIYLPLYEAKMIWLYDHRYGTFEGVSSRSNTSLPTPDEKKHQNPFYLVQPWYWVNLKDIRIRLENLKNLWLTVYRNITNATNERTTIFSSMPLSGIGGSLHMNLFPSSDQKKFYLACFVSNISSLVFDWVARQKVSGVNFSLFYFKQLPVLPPSFYKPKDIVFILPRVLELVYTAWDVKPFADEIWNSAPEELRTLIGKQWEENANETGGHDWMLPEWISAYPEIERDPKRGIPFPPFKWSESRRATLMAELDAYYAILYGLSRKQLRYILDPHDLTPKELEDILDPKEEILNPLEDEEYHQRASESNFPGETFRVLKNKEIQKYGEYRTRRLVLEAWDRLKKENKNET